MGPKYSRRSAPRSRILCPDFRDCGARLGVPDQVNRLYRTGLVLEVGAGTQEKRKRIIADELLKN